MEISKVNNHPKENKYYIFTEEYGLMCCNTKEEVEARLLEFATRNLDCMTVIYGHEFTFRVVLDE